jgi:hypothetical protein
MSREATAAMLAALAARAKKPVVFYEGEYSTGTLRLWSGVGTLSWNGQSWLGAGELLQVAPIGEVSHVGAVGFSVTLTGESTAILAANIGAAQQGLPGKVWLGALDAAGALIADPVLCFSGRLDVPDTTDSGQLASITVKYESRMVDLDRPRLRRWTHESQQLDQPGDLGFEYVAALQDAKLPWGSGIAITADVNAFNSRLRAVRGG